jgi:hypothetical protein
VRLLHLFSVGGVEAVSSQCRGNDEVFVREDDDGIFARDYDDNEIFARDFDDEDIFACDYGVYLCMDLFATTTLCIG